MRGFKIWVAAFFMMMIPLAAKGQRFTVATNIADIANLGTLNLEASYSIRQKWSIFLQSGYNPFTYNYGKINQFQHKSFSLSSGFRYWFWHSSSGWFTGAKLQYSLYNYGGLVSSRTEEGHGFAGGLFAGYAIMLTPNLNLELGAGALLGIRKYTLYDCPRCGGIIGKGIRPFIFPDNLIIQLVYIF